MVTPQRVQGHTGLTHHFWFLTFGLSGAQCQKLKNGGLDQYGPEWFGRLILLQSEKCRTERVNLLHWQILPPPVTASVLYVGTIIAWHTAVNRYDRFSINGSIILSHFSSISLINVKNCRFITTCKAHHWVTHIKQQKLISSHHGPKI